MDAPRQANALPGSFDVSKLAGFKLRDMVLDDFHRQQGTANQSEGCEYQAHCSNACGRYRNPKERLCHRLARQLNTLANENTATRSCSLTSASRRNFDRFSRFCREQHVGSDWILRIGWTLLWSSTERADVDTVNNTPPGSRINGVIQSCASSTMQIP